MEELRRGSVRSDTVISFFEIGTSIHQKHPTGTRTETKGTKTTKARAAQQLFLPLRLERVIELLFTPQNI